MAMADQRVRTFPTLLRSKTQEKLRGSEAPPIQKEELASNLDETGPQSSTSSYSSGEARRVETPPLPPTAPFREEGEEASLSKDQALCLQSELMAAFNTPEFQKQLHELGRAQAAGSADFRAGLLQLVRSKQLEIIPQFGFDSSEAGITRMLRVFKSLEADPDIQVNKAAIKELLSLELPSLSVPQARMVVERPRTKHRILDLLRCQLIEFSKATFQNEVDELKRQARQNDVSEGYYHLPGRAELALLVQQALLPQYGFAASKEGVQEMIRHCAPFIQDPDVASLLDRVNERLGMSPEACKRFRELLAHLS